MKTLTDVHVESMRMLDAEVRGMCPTRIKELLRFLNSQPLNNANTKRVRAALVRELAARQQ
jgi:hypothetical protein